MSRTLPMLLLLAFALSGCHAHKEMQYTPAQYAKLRGIELLTTPPTRPYELVATVEGTGGKFTAEQTMINAMIDAAQKAGARALIPLEFAGEGTTGSRTGLQLFVFTETTRRITKGRAIRWTGN